MGSTDSENGLKQVFGIMERRVGWFVELVDGIKKGRLPMRGRPFFIVLSNLIPAGAVITSVICDAF